MMKPNDADTAFDNAKDYMFAPLQNLPYADRALIFVEPGEFWALLLLRKGDELSAYSTTNQEEGRRNKGWNYSISSLKGLLSGARSQELEQAIEYFGDNHILSLLPADKSSPGDFILLAGVTCDTADYRFPGDAELGKRLKTHFAALLNEHMGIEVDERVFGKPGSKSYNAGVLDQPSFFRTTPLRGPSPHATPQDQPKP